MQVTHDPQADAVYVRLSLEPVHESEEVRPGVVFDYSEDGRLVAIEVLNASRTLATQPAGATSTQAA